MTEQPHHFEAPDNLHLTPEAAKEWEELQAAICEMLVINRVTTASQIDPELHREVQVHLAICDVENHGKIDGLYDQD